MLRAACCVGNQAGAALCSAWGHTAKGIQAQATTLSDSLHPSSGARLVEEYFGPVDFFSILPLALRKGAPACSPAKQKTSPCPDELPTSHELHRNQSAGVRVAPVGLRWAATQLHPNWAPFQRLGPSQARRGRGEEERHTRPSRLVLSR